MSRSAVDNRSSYVTNFLDINIDLCMPINYVG
jgi:hypothetical protein